MIVIFLSLCISFALVSFTITFNENLKIKGCHIKIAKRTSPLYNPPVFSLYTKLLNVIFNLSLVVSNNLFVWNKVAKWANFLNHFQTHSFCAINILFLSMPRGCLTVLTQTNLNVCLHFFCLPGKFKSPRACGV